LNETLRDTLNETLRDTLHETLSRRQKETAPKQLERCWMLAPVWTFGIHATAQPRCTAQRGPMLTKLRCC
jgi:hypothetical protein